MFERPQRSTDRYLTVLASPNGLEHPRLGLAIARKHLRRAVDRNLLKRLIRESFRMHQGTLACVDFVVLARQGTAGTPRLAWRASLERHWSRFAR